MKLPLTVTFRGLPHSASVEAAARRRAEQLEHFGRVASVAVTIGPHGGCLAAPAPLEARVRLLVPGGEIVVNGGSGGHPDPYAALTQAFDAARRQLEDFLRARALRASPPPPRIVASAADR